jgi:SAM-dependent methyltransferase
MLNPDIKLKIKNTLPKSLIGVLVYLKHLCAKKIPHHHIYISHVADKKGVEIGGPSILFKTTLPLYQRVLSLDGVNFSNATVWEGEIQQGLNYPFMRNRKGIQYISDATDLAQIKDGAYDFLLSSNCLEHIANPIKALMEWRRVIKNGGSLILVLPNKASNFDHRRPTTPFNHLLQDFNSDVSEHDLTHLEEILKLHDLSMDPPAGNKENFERRSLDNYKNRTLHHHIFDLKLMVSMLEYCGFEIIQQTETDINFYTLAINKI